MYLSRYIPASPASLVQMNSMKSRSLANPRWQRVVFKISGAALAAVSPDNIDPKVSFVGLWTAHCSSLTLGYPYELCYEITMQHH